jgi:recombinational DNA repair protein (RecF pathway)
MHHIHLTKALVLSSFPLGESGKILHLLTKDFGVIRVNAEATRKLNSKLRQSIQDFSLSEIALVYGKRGWILTNAKILENFYFKIKEKFDEKKQVNKIQTIQRLFSLVERMIPFEHDEEQGSFFFDLILETIKKILELENEQNKSLEIMTVYKIVNFLGYVGENKLDQEKITSDLEYISQNEKQIVEIINKALKESHL